MSGPALPPGLAQGLARLGPLYWQARLGRWWAPPASEPADGYSLLLPVPGDLPVFLRLALAVCAHQDSRHRVETVVVPDRMTPEVRRLVDEARPGWDGPLVLAPLRWPERQVLPRLGNPGRNHAVQLVTGVQASRATHIVLHDADLFLLSSGALDRQYELARDGSLACVGISPPWDPWYREHGLELAATWELCARVDWLRKFPPYMHMAHRAKMFGEQHMFDTTFRAQSLTDPELVAVQGTDDVVHFNYVISNYRNFLRRGPSPWCDGIFRLTLVSVFVELFDPSNRRTYQLPTLRDLAGCLGREGGAVTFPGQEAAARYAEFRRLLGRALCGPWTGPEEQERLVGALAPFDDFYGLAEVRAAGR